MMQQPPNPGASDQEQQAQQMTQTMQVMMPLMIIYFSLITPAGLGLYWFVSNCFAIIQQYLVNGWGGGRRAQNDMAPAPAPVPAPANASPKRTRKPRK
jgi:membrane protein insertase Oxa1/YidC/SpoIIIJ